MGEVIAIAGKGGVGKTTIAALLTLLLARLKIGSVLAVDADPNSNLADALGLKSPGTMADVVDEVAKNPDVVPKNMGKDAYIEYKIHRDITENEGFDLLAMGRPEGPGCYCYINNVLRSIMAKVVADYKHVIIDNEAGMEHFSRKTTRACQKLVLVSDETRVGLRSAKRIMGLVEELGIAAEKKFLIVNRARGTVDAACLKTDFVGAEVFLVPFDETLIMLSAEGQALRSLPKESGARKAVEKVGEALWPER